MNNTNSDHNLIEKQFEAIFKFSYDGIWICDGGGTILRCNPAAEHINHIKAAEVVGKHISVLVTGGVVDRTVTEEVLREKRQFTVMQYCPRTGKKLLVTGSPIINDSGEIAFVVTNDRDITDLDRLRHRLLEHEARSRRFQEELQRRDKESALHSRLLGRSSTSMQRLLATAANVANFKINLFISGESGTGKTMLAETIHQLSPRRDKPFVRVDCGSIPSNLFESELFGYESGAFTGARSAGKMGLFEMADGGTLFLDELADVPLEVQHKLLRFIEKGELIRVGGTKVREVDVRLISATNRDLDEEVAAGRFRDDLYYRVRVVPLSLPPLRERQEDLPFLINQFLMRFCKQYGTQKTLSAPALEALIAYDWPGNVRELENLMERLAVMGPGEVIEMNDLPQRIQQHEAGVDFVPMFSGKNLKEATAKFQRMLIQATLDREGTQVRAAKALGVSQATIARKLAKSHTDISA
ncbi:MAG: sigma 54-interacting transcriptional regulator [Deltaproteobacteria bacterium]|nr:sigma 54-interacting transcriptional regulator [Deltaproteobacteria bacterium]